MPKNQILYGPPGTGKTYNVVKKALEIIDKVKYEELVSNDASRSDWMDEYKKYVENKQIQFCTFHQSYSYEDFVEGLRSDEKGNFVPTNGIFLDLCKAAELSVDPTVSTYDFDDATTNFFKMSLGEINNDAIEIFDYCVENNVIALGYGRDVDFAACSNQTDIKSKLTKEIPDIEKYAFEVAAIERFKNKLSVGDIVLIADGNLLIRGIAKVTGEYLFNDSTEIRYNHFRKVDWLYTGDSIDVNQFLRDKVLSQQTIYRFKKADLNIEYIKNLLGNQNTIKKASSSNFVLIIDEINRGNISKIFGELITLIETDKRKGKENEVLLKLPYSKKEFGVPPNVFIIGTMNTADRSISLMDTALRRRFEFIEMGPNPDLLSSDIQGVNVVKLLSAINSRIQFLYDRDHMIGHAFFITENLDLESLKEIMRKKVIPLLQDYFYDDWEKIELILGGASSNDKDNYFLSKVKVNPNKIFGSQKVNDYESTYKYKVVKEPSLEAFINVYKDID